MLAAVIVLGFITASCGTREPSHTRVLCDRLAVANANGDADRADRVINAMLDLGTEQTPTAVEPRVYVHALLLMEAAHADDFDAFSVEMDSLVLECAKVER